MSGHEHETRLTLAELRIQRAKLIGVFATSVAAMSTAAVVLVPMVSAQSAAARQAAPEQQAAPSAVPSAAPPPAPDEGEPSSPSPRDVCQHVVDLMKAELGEQVDTMPAEEVENILDNCIREAENERKLKGDAVYDEQAKCVFQASSLQGLERCEASSS